MASSMGADAGGDANDGCPAGSLGVSMAMMRGGSLDRYLPIWVLRQAADDSFSGSITFGRTPPSTVYFDRGDVYAAVVGTEPPSTEASVTEADETEHLGRTV